MGANDKQLEVINELNGIYIVDAGAGTGKTYTITQRYLNILNNGISPDNILLVTFTRNAATHMKEKVISKAKHEIKADVLEAPILNFDSFCFKIISKYGLNAPKILGIEDNLSGFKLITQSVIQRRVFNKFFNQFLEKYEDTYKEILVKITNETEINSLIEQLLSKGVYPTKESWFLDSEIKLKGNLGEYLKRFNELNKEGIGARGSVQSELLNKFNKKKNYLDLPEDLVLGKQINPELGEIAFNDNRENFLKFIHHIYFDYIEYMIRENLMTFSLTAMFAFLILYNDDEIRRANSFDYVMVDEFQDTNEMQFMLILLLMKKPNLCVVGDWKQGIYGFRNATISNIRDFENKINVYKNQLNKTKTRIKFDLGKITPLEFDINYRSSQKILTFSEKSLIINGKQDELNEKQISQIQKDIVSLKSKFEYNDCSEIKFYEAKDRETEIDYILQKIQELVGKKTIKYFDSKTEEYKERVIEFNDIAILSRNRTFGLEIQKRAFQYNIPAVYEGGVKLFEEEPAILLLAWLKLLLYKDKRDAWIPILEKENYTFSQIKYILDTKEYPEEILSLREHLLQNKKIINYVIDEIFKKYNFSNVISNTILNILEQIFHSTLMSISELIVFIEENIENGETYNIELEGISNSITIQTIHGSKGLEYPIVFVVNCNISNFPNNNSDSNSITYNELVGIRTKKLFSPKHKYIFDNWKTELVNYGIFSDLDEERRLLYVAITRAMYDVYITSHRPSEFYKGLAEDNSEFIEKADIKKLEIDNKIQNYKLNIKTKINNFDKIISVHDLMEFKEGQKGRGMEFGTMIHKLAFRYINNLPVKNIRDNCLQDFENIKNFIDNDLKGGKFMAEIDCSLPIDGVLIRGIIDLVVEFEDKIEVIDWKTDLVKDNLEEYSKQLSVYYQVLKDIYPEKEIICKIFWTNTGEVDIIKPIKMEIIS